MLYITDMIFSPVLCSVVLLFWLVRLSLLVWCIAPSVNNGSTVIFARVVYPLFLKFGKHIDDNVGKARELVSVGVAEVKTVVTEVMEEVSENVLDDAVNSNKLLEDVAEFGNKFMETSKTKLTEGFGNLINAAA